MVYYDVVEVKALGPLRLFVRFRDGLTGEAEFRENHLLTRFGLRILFIGSTNGLLGTIAPASQKFTYCSESQIKNDC